MMRFQLDRPAIKRRQSQVKSMQTDGGRWSDSRFNVSGRLRKRSPFASCAPSLHCMCCEAERVERRQAIKRLRASARHQIDEATVDL